MAWTTTSDGLAGKIVAPVNRLLLDLDRALGLKVGKPGPEGAGAADDLPADTFPANPGDLSAQTSASTTSQSLHSTNIPRNANSVSQTPDITAPDSTVAGLSGIASRITGIRTMPSIPRGTITSDNGHPQKDRPDAVSSSPIGSGDVQSSPGVKQDPSDETPSFQAQSHPRILRILPLTRRQSAPFVPGIAQGIPGMAEVRTGPQPASAPQAVGNLLPLKVARAYGVSRQPAAVTPGDLRVATLAESLKPDGLALLSSPSPQDSQNSPGASPKSASPVQNSLGQLAAPLEHTGPHRVPDLMPGAGLSLSRGNNPAHHARPVWAGPTPGYWGRREMPAPSGAGPNTSGWLTLFPLEAGRVAERVSEKIGPSFQQADRLVRGTLGISPGAAPQSAPTGNGASSSRVQNNFNVSVSIKGNGSEVDLDPEMLEEAIVNVLKDAARRHGLEV